MTVSVFSSRTQSAWIAQIPPAPPLPNGPAVPYEDKATAECKRALSDLLRCTNLIVLSGLGTSLCVQANAQGQKAPTMGDLWEAVRQKQDQAASPFSGIPNFAQLLALVRHPADKPDIEALLSKCKLAESFLEGDTRAHLSRFILLAELHIIRATSFVDVNHALPVHGEFLRRVARRSQRKPRAKVFTTNYDRCFEEAGRQGRYVVVDGFSQTDPATFDAIHFTYETVRRIGASEAMDPIPNLFHLYKLHGSVDWRRQHPSGEITKSDGHGSPVLVYPRNSKYELAFEQPYLEMISAFQAVLREPDTGLLVIGFGFNDNHLAEPIMSAMRSNLSLKMAVVSPRLAPWQTAAGPVPGECGTNKHLGRLAALASAGDARITLVNCGFDQIVPLIPDVMAETDLEQHLARLRSLDAI